jgi:hypothetical protein
MRVMPLLPLLLTLALAGCNGVPLLTQWKLRHFDVSTADIAKLRIALRAPDWVTPTPDKTLIEATRAQDDGERQTFIRLRRALHADEAAELARIAPEPARLEIYEVAPQDLAAVAGLQQDALRARREGGANKGSLKIGSGVACRNAAVPEGPILIDVYIRPDDETGWLPLLQGFDLRPGLGTVEAMRDFDASVPPCEKLFVRSKSRAAR